jgi:hypothetical protein
VNSERSLEVPLSSLTSHRCSFFQDTLQDQNGGRGFVPVVALNCEDYVFAFHPEHDPSRRARQTHGDEIRVAISVIEPRQRKLVRDAIAREARFATREPAAADSVCFEIQA